jgi:hypothetical protein
MIETTFDPLQALSLAYTALNDPSALEVEATEEDARMQRLYRVPLGYATERINEVIGALHYEPANDARAEAVWVLTHLGRLLANVADELVDDDLVPATFDEAAAQIRNAGDRIDEAIEALS